MCDIFTSKNVKETFRNMFILMLGDSNMKAYYKDLIYLSTNNNIADPNYFMNPPKNHKRKAFCGDSVISLNEATSGRDYYEEREFVDSDAGLKIQFKFLTNVYGKTMKRILRDIEDKIIPMPNVIIMNSCLWDLTRWGPKMEEQYMKNLIALFGKMRRIIPTSVQVIWTTTPPMSCCLVKGGVLIKQLEFTKHTVRFMVIEANSFVRKLCVLFERDLLDLHYHLRYQVHRRSIDGIHWEPQAVRHVVCLILTHIAISCNKKLPGNFDNDMVKETVALRDRRNNVLDNSLPAKLKEEVDEQLKVSERPATVSLKAIKMKEAFGIPDSHEPRKTKKIRRRLPAQQSSTNNHTSNENHPPTGSKSLHIKPVAGISASLAGRINYDNIVYNTNRPSTSGQSSSNRARNRKVFRKPNKHTSNRDRYALYDNAVITGADTWTATVDNSLAYYQPRNMNLLYNPDFWSSLSLNFATDTLFFDNRSSNRH